jgi:transposase
MHENKMKSLEKDLLKKMNATKKHLRKLCKTESNCEPDAHKDVQRWLNDHPLFRFNKYDITTLQKKAEKKRGLIDGPERYRANTAHLVIYSFTHLLICSIILSTMDKKS